MKFQKIVSLVLEARDFDLRKIQALTGPKGMPQQSALHGLGFFKPEDQTSRKMYDPSHKDKHDVLGSVINPKPVRETEKIVYDGMMIAISDPDSKKIVEDILEKYLTIYQDMESELREQARLGVKLDNSRKSLQRETDLSYEKRDADKLRKLSNDIDELESQFDNCDIKIQGFCKLMDKMEDPELNDEKGHYKNVELGEVYTKIYEAVNVALKHIIEKAQEGLPIDKKKDITALVEALEPIYKDGAADVIDCLIAYRTKGGVNAIAALKKFKENVIAKREDAKAGVSKGYMKFDPVMALGYVLRFVSAKAEVIASASNTPVTNIAGPKFEKRADPKLEAVISLIKQDKSKRDRKTLLAAMEKLTHIEGTDEAQDILRRYLDGVSGITEGSVISAIRRSQVA